jgi:membrane protein
MKISKNFLKRLLNFLKSNDLQLTATSLSFMTVLGIIPFIVVTFTLFQAFSGLETFLPKAENFIFSYLKGPAGVEGLAIIKKVLARAQSGRLGTISVVGLILTSVFLIRDMEKAVNRVWGHLPSRSWLRGMILYWSSLLAFPFALAAAVAITTVNQNFLMQPLLIFLFLLVLYKLVPNTKVHLASAVFGSLISSIFLSLLFKFFHKIVTQIFTYSKVYGSIAVIPTFLIWILVVWYIILSGVMITSHLQRSRKHG